MSGRRDPVADELAIRDLVSRYADAVCRGNAVELAATFTPDGEWVYPALGHPQGSDAIRDLFDQVLAGFDLIIQALLSGRVALDGAGPDRAAGRWYIAEFGRQADGREFRASGVYHDVYVREAGAWRFARRRFDPLFGQADDGIVVTPFPADVPEL